MLAPRNTGRGTRNEHQTVIDPLARIADALERIAEHHTSTVTKGPEKTHVEPQLTFADANYAARLTAWLTRAPDSDQPMCDAHNVLLDAVKQATKRETIEWLAALAERYGFNNEGTTQ